MPPILQGVRGYTLGERAPVDGSFPILTVVRSFVDIRHTKSMRIKRAITTVWSFFHLGYPLGLRAATRVRKGITYQLFFRSSGISPRQRNTHLIGQPFCSALY